MTPKPPTRTEIVAYILIMLIAGVIIDKVTKPECQRDCVCKKP